MTRKDYKRIADAFAEARNHFLRDDAPSDGPSFKYGLQAAAREVARTLAHENPRFDRGRFMAACGFPEE